MLICTFLEMFPWDALSLSSASHFLQASSDRKEVCLSLVFHNHIRLGQKGITKNLCDKDSAELSDEISGLFYSVLPQIVQKILSKCSCES